ncbi:MAG TPA: pyridoxal phosphate-dependent aminotransferase [Prolixibacteraceae bacterium]|nr:pyridoxal phosphate-dependent aminotransferase [Prolixibacteraceae bacterium]
MPAISHRGVELPESAIRKLVPYAEKAKALGRKVYHLNIGQPDIKTPQHAIERIRNFNFDLIPYGHSFGNDTYRNKLAQYYRDRNLEVDASQILITTGGSEAISFAFMVCFNPGDEVIIPEPFYANYLSFAIANNVVIKPISSTIETGFQLPSIAEFEKVITPKTKGIFICNPNNPTGYVYTREELEQLQELVLKYDLFLLADEVYSEFVYDGKTHYSVLELQRINENVVMIDSVSKRFSACGIRIGSLVSKNRLVIKTIAKLAMARLCPPMLGQVVAEAAVDSPPEYMEDVYREYLQRRDYFINALNEIEGVYSPMPMGAFYSMVRLPIDDSDRFCQWMLEEFEYEGATVMMAPASGFYYSENAGKNEVRVAYVLNRDDLQASIVCLKEALKVYPGRTI